MYDRPYTGKVAEEVEAIVFPSVSFGSAEVSGEGGKDAVDTA